MPNFCRFLCIAIITILIAGKVHGQHAVISKYKIEGHINADTGEIKLIFAADSGYYPAPLKQIVTKVKNKSFSFEGEIPYPVGVQLIYNHAQYVSASFVVEKGSQSVACNIDSSKKVPDVQNEIMQKDYIAYLKAFKSITETRRLLDQRWDSLKKLYNNIIPDTTKAKLMNELREGYVKHDSTLLEYVQLNPGSYVAFWKFASLMDFGYENIFKSIFSNFSQELKASYTGKILQQKIDVASSLTGVGKPFPLLNCVDLNNRRLTKAIYSGDQYTLVDFWYSNCGPCNAQFDELKQIYSKYKNAGFQIIGISTDKQKFEKNWESVIEKRKLNWPQYWDKDGLESQRLSIVAFPTNFLLDKDGKIIMKNIQPFELEHFLKGNIK